MSERYGYTGIYFGVKYFMHTYKPTEELTKHLITEFAHNFSVDDYVAYREPHKRTESGTINEVAYSTEKNGVGTIKVYKLNGEWISEGCIKRLVS